jgi:branched-chain amino acid transport system permease protein
MIERLIRNRTAQVVAALVVLYLVLYPVPGSPLPGRMPVGVVTQGIIYGTSYALIGMGLILIYRTTRIVNFAYGAMGAMPGALTVGLYVGKHVNWFVAMGVGVLVGFVAGGLTDLLVIRRFANSSRLVLTVATIGLAQLLGAIGLGFLINLLGGNKYIGNIKTPLSSSFTVRPYLIRGDHVLLLGMAPLLLAGLAWLMLRTSTGRAVRAAAENNDRALLLGVPVKRLQTLVWAIAGGLSAITYVMTVPFKGVTPDPGVSASAILPGLAVAVIARFKSFPVALAGGLGLGIAEWTIRWNVRKESVFDVTFLVVILVSLLVQRDRSTRAETGESSWDAAGLLKPIPAMLRRLPEVRGAKWALISIGTALVLWLPVHAKASEDVLLSFALIWALVAVSLVVLTGWGGNISLGQFGIVGISAMAAGELMERWNVDLFLAIVAAMAVGALVAVLIGVPALRIRGLYLAVTTLAFAVALDSYVLNPNNFPALVPGHVIRPVVWKRFDLGSERTMFFFCLAALAVALLVVRRVRGTRAGRAIIGTRDNERAAGAMAIPTTRVKLQTFVLSGCLAGLAGALYVAVLTNAGQGTFSPGMSLQVFSFAVIGGLGSVSGAMSGVFLFRLLDFVINKYGSGNAAVALQQAVTGAGLLFILYFLPGGLWQLVHRVRDRYLRWVANRHGIVAPSLVADKRVEDDIDLTDGDDDHAEDETEVIAGALS